MQASLFVLREVFWPLSQGRPGSRRGSQLTEQAMTSASRPGRPLRAWRAARARLSPELRWLVAGRRRLPSAREVRDAVMTLVAYIALFVLVAIMGAGLPGLGDASLIAAGARAGEGHLDIWIVLAVAMVAWMLGSAAGYAVGVRQGRGLLERPGWLAGTRLKLLAKGDRACGRHTLHSIDDLAGLRVRDLPGAFSPVLAGSAGRWYRLDRHVRGDFVFPRRRDRPARWERRHGGDARQGRPAEQDVPRGACSRPAP
jgi:hypothetical protein